MNFSCADRQVLMPHSSSRIAVSRWPGPSGNLGRCSQHLRVAAARAHRRRRHPRSERPQRLSACLSVSGLAKASVSFFLVVSVTMLYTECLRSHGMQIFSWLSSNNNWQHAVNCCAGPLREAPHSSKNSRAFHATRPRPTLDLVQRFNYLLTPALKCYIF